MKRFLLIFPAMSAGTVQAAIALVVALGFHLWHGVWSMLQTLGLSHPRWNPLRRLLATSVALAVTCGNISFPIAVLLGLVRE